MNTKKIIFTGIGILGVGFGGGAVLDANLGDKENPTGLVRFTGDSFNRLSWPSTAQLVQEHPTITTGGVGGVGALLVASVGLYAIKKFRAQKNSPLLTDDKYLEKCANEMKAVELQVEAAMHELFGDQKASGCLGQAVELANIKFSASPENSPNKPSKHDIDVLSQAIENFRHRKDSDSHSPEVLKEKFEGLHASLSFFFKDRASLPEKVVEQKQHAENMKQIADELSHCAKLLHEFVRYFGSLLHHETGAEKWEKQLHDLNAEVASLEVNKEKKDEEKLAEKIGEMREDFKKLVGKPEELAAKVKGAQGLVTVRAKDFLRKAETKTYKQDSVASEQSSQIANAYTTLKQLMEKLSDGASGLVHKAKQEHTLFLEIAAQVREDFHKTEKKADRVEEITSESGDSNLAETTIAKASKGFLKLATVGTLGAPIAIAIRAWLMSTPEGFSEDAVKKAKDWFDFGKHLTDYGITGAAAAGFVALVGLYGVTKLGVWSLKQIWRMEKWIWSGSKLSPADKKSGGISEFQSSKIETLQEKKQDKAKEESSSLELSPSVKKYIDWYKAHKKELNP